MSDYGFEVYAPNGRKRVSLDTEMTKILYEHTLAPWDDGHATVGLQGHTKHDAFAVVLLSQSGAITPRAPHRVWTRDNGNGTLTVYWRKQDDADLRAYSILMVTSDG